MTHGFQASCLSATLAAVCVATPADSVRHDNESDELRGTLFTNVVFTGDTLLVKSIVLRNTITHETVYLSPYRGRFVGTPMTGYVQRGGLVFQEIPSGVYEVSELRSLIDNLPTIELSLATPTFRVQADAVNYVGDLVINAIERNDIWSLTIRFVQNLQAVDDTMHKYPELFDTGSLVLALPGKTPSLIEPKDLHSKFDQHEDANAVGDP